MAQSQEGSPRYFVGVDLSDTEIGNATERARQSIMFHRPHFALRRMLQPHIIVIPPQLTDPVAVRRYFKEQDGKTGWGGTVYAKPTAWLGSEERGWHTLAAGIAHAVPIVVARAQMIDQLIPDSRRQEFKDWTLYNKPHVSIVQPQFYSLGYPYKKGPTEMHLQQYADKHLQANGIPATAYVNAVHLFEGNGRDYEVTETWHFGH